VTDTAPALERVTAVITNWNTSELAIRAAQGLFSDGLPPSRLVVVDNGSTDDSVERLSAELPDSRLVPIERNIGFARAVNRGAPELEGDAYLLVNSDAFLERPGSLGRLLAALDDPQVGIAVPRLLNEDHTLQPNVAPISSPGVALVRASGLSRFVPNRWQPRWSTHWDHSWSQRIEAAMGAVILVRAETWRSLGGFRERQHMYAEDLDLCWRARKAGWGVFFVHDSVFVHLGREPTSGYWTSPVRAEAVGVSEADMIRQHLGPLAARLTLGFMCAGFAVRWVAFRALGKRDRAAVMRGALRGYLGRPSAERQAS
jgi:N-acetylglucosaminyl-diphospho-decaprenol L-rhamnosyltransferase